MFSPGGCHLVTSCVLHWPPSPIAAPCLQDKPGLRLMQYKSLIFERWQKDPRNPRNFPKPEK